MCPQRFTPELLQFALAEERRNHSDEASEDDRRDRGNYAPNLQVMNTTYDYATGLGPLAANSLVGGRRPEVSDVMKLLPAERK